MLFSPDTDKVGLKEDSVQEGALIFCATTSVNEDIQKAIMFSTQVNNKAIFPPTLQHSCNVLGLK